MSDELTFQLGTPGGGGGLEELEYLNAAKVCQITGEPDASMVTYFEAVVNTQVPPPLPRGEGNVVADPLDPPLSHYAHTCRHCCPTLLWGLLSNGINPTDLYRWCRSGTWATSAPGCSSSNSTIVAWSVSAT